MKEQKMEIVKNMNVNNFNNWLKNENEEGWCIAHIQEWKTYIGSSRLDFVILMEKGELL